MTGLIPKIQGGFRYKRKSASRSRSVSISRSGRRRSIGRKRGGGKCQGGTRKRKKKAVCGN